MPQGSPMPRGEQIAKPAEREDALPVSFLRDGYTELVDRETLECHTTPSMT